jgi:acid phosphatase type 7
MAERGRSRRIGRTALAVVLISASRLFTPIGVAPALASGDPVLAAAGDIACPTTDSAYNGGNGTSTGCQQKATSNLLVNLAPAAIAALGDNQYDDGSATQFNSVFNPTWGRVKPTIHPAIGNHEIKTDSTATGYFNYFGPAAGTAGKGWYSYTLGTWHVVVLNGNCSNIGGCGAGSPEEQWLRSDLAAHPAACTLAYWHQPRFSSGNHGSSTLYTPFWQDLYNAGVDVVLNGHDHDYERFAPQTPSGALDNSRGIREFVVGTGGAHWEQMGSVKPNSQIRNQTFGVLALTLHAGSYDWKFIPQAGKTFTDSGTTACH